jgi:glycosyltransferase involved in cell wall biosynthesis
MNSKENKHKIFIVVGRLGERLTKSKITPFTHSDLVEQVFVFAETEGKPLDKTVYITHPRWTKKIKVKLYRKLFRFIFEPCQLIYYSLKYRPFLINGVYTLPKGLYSVIASKIARTNVVVSIIGGIPETISHSRFKFFWKKVNIWIYKNADVVTTKGTMIKDCLIKKGIKESKIEILNGAIETIDEQKDKDNKDIDILFVGNFSTLKGPDRVIDMIELLINEYSHKQIKAVFLGDGPLFNSINDHIHQNNLTQNVILEGYVSNVLDYYCRAKVLVMPSTSEGLSTAMLEAMSGRCVPVVSNVGNMTDAAHHDCNAYVVDNYNDIPLFATYINKLLSDEKLRKSFSAKGEELVKNNYTVKSQSLIVNHIIDILQTK